MINTAIGKRLLEPRYSSVGDLSVAEPEKMQAAELLQVFQASVGDFGPSKTETFQCGLALELLQARVGDLSINTVADLPDQICAGR